ncbi:hypothetical protein [Actinoplanes sp. NPDC049265]|uniref:hypothetical protein n=1 Tax=Actinoplanes sp. NPDC049265 TaxID=3363902 RepID=UPI00371328E6
MEVTDFPSTEADLSSTGAGSSSAGAGLSFTEAGFSFTEAERTDAAVWSAMAAASMSMEAGIEANLLAGGVVVTRPAVDSLFWNQAQSFDRELTREDVEAILHRFQSRGVSKAMLKVTPVSAGDDWENIAAATGLSRSDGGELKWAAPVDNVLEAVADSRTELRVARVEPPDARRWSEKMWEIFGMVDEAAIGAATAVLDQPGWQGYSAWDGDEIAAVGLLHIRGQFAQLLSGATAEKYRSRGAQSALIAARAQAAQQAGAKWITAETSVEPGGLNTSARNLKRAALTNVYKKTFWTWSA